jgi:hypothetical protein
MKLFIQMRCGLLMAVFLVVCAFAVVEEYNDNFEWLNQYNVVWTTQSKNSSESMPVCGPDIGLNVWVEKGELLIYVARAGCYDENGALLKLGRIRVNLQPNPFEGDGFYHQELKLYEGFVEIQGGRGEKPEATVRIWVEIYRPVAHLEIDADHDVSVTATYETWRHEDMELPNDPSKFARRGMIMMDYDKYSGEVKVYRYVIEPGENGVVFYHRNRTVTVFDHQVRQQELGAVRDKMYDRLAGLTFGGMLTGDNLVHDGTTMGEYAGTPFRGWSYKSKTPRRHHHFGVYTHIEQIADIKTWENGLNLLVGAQNPTPEEAWQKNVQWWKNFWQRSWIVINPDQAGTGDAGWQVGRNYNLFRYMLASNIYGRGATPFNGGLFTFDPRHTRQEIYKIDPEEGGWTPDHRQWGAGLTQQNQRMIYWPMLKSGDFDLMPPGFSFYQSGLVNATARVRHYWDHDGCAFPEQPSITGLPGSAVYGHLTESELRGRPENLNTEGTYGRQLTDFIADQRRNRPENLEPGVEVNPASGNLFESQLEWAWMMLEYHRFSGADLTPYLPFIEQAVIFYDEHYRFRNKQRTGKELDEDGKLVIYPANSLENHPNARNTSLPIVGLHQLLTRLLELPEEYCTAQQKNRWQAILERLPDLPVGEVEGHRILKVAENYSDGNFVKMYALWPFQAYGLGLPDIELMRDTFLYGVSEGARESITAFMPGFIYYARLGMAEKAREKAIGKLGSGPYRFPTFWPESIDYTPDFNWGGSGMVGLQEMLLQTHPAAPASLHGYRTTGGLRIDAADGENIRLFPAWPEDWNVDFKLHAPQQTVVEARLRKGKVIELKITPESRQKDMRILRYQID